ncbi:MAG: hypothetical protein ACRCZK_01505, partial [Oscillospiraceae bacterium]
MKKFFSIALTILLLVSIFTIPVNEIAIATEDINKTTESQQEEIKEAVQFNKPIEMRASVLNPGVDFFVGDSKTETTVKAQIDTAINDIKNYGFNTVILPITYENKVIYSTDLFNSIVFDDVYFDIIAYTIEKVRENKMYIYLDFDVNIKTDETGDVLYNTGIEFNSTNETIKILNDIVNKHDIDGIILDNYYNSPSNNMYLQYRQQNSGLSFESWLQQWTESVFDNVIEHIKNTKPNIQVGAYLDEVWLSNSIIENGTPSNNPFSALNNGFADTKKIVETKDLNFAILKTVSSTSNSQSNFTNIINWWSQFAVNKDIPFYIQHSNNLLGSNETGWAKHDELIRQAIVSRGVQGFSGSSFESLSALKENKFNSTTALIKYYKNEVDPNLILTDFRLANIKDNTFTTYEVEFGFLGAADPNFELTLNDQAVKVEKNGAFSLAQPLNIGLNTFVFKHKGDIYTYNITRAINIFSAISPVGTIRVEGGSSIEIAANAYRGAKVTATINGRTVTLKESEIQSDNTENNSYIQFIGSYSVQGASAQDKNIGGITFTGRFEGITQSKKSGNIVINKKFVPPPAPPPAPDTGNPDTPAPPPGQGGGSPADNYQAVIINSNSYGGAEGYDPYINTRYPAVNSSLIPAGTIDYIASNRISYGNEYYYILKSGTRVNQREISFINNPKHGYDKINSVNIQNSGTRLFMTVDNNFKSSFKVNYLNVNYDLVNNGINGNFSASGIEIVFDNTKGTPNINMPNNYIFSGSSWRVNGDQTILTLNLAKNGRFFGFSTSYDGNGNLVFHFNNISPANGGRL